MYNKITVMGRIATVPELKTSQNGIPYARFRVAVNRRFHNKDNEQVDFFNVTAWRNNAEFICKYFSKGSMIMLDGEMQTQQYEDRNGNIGLLERSERAVQSADVQLWRQRWR